jgi:DNA-binding NarL/FixJ family response regulator
VVHEFVLTADNRATIAQICRQLGGMPLAIELAAAWIHALTPDEIAAELTRGLDFLALSDRDGDGRHRSMRVTLDHSWTLLTPHERRTMARLSVFRGGCDRDAAAVVAEASLPTLAALIDKSLVQREQQGGTTRYTLHELVRQYAAERLREDAADESATEARHAAYYADLLQQSISAHTGGSSPEAWTQVIRDMDNVRSAWTRAAPTGNVAALLGMARGLTIIYDHHGWLRDGMALFGHAAEALRSFGEPANAARGLILGTQGYFQLRTGQPAEGAQLLEQGVALMQSAGATTESAFLLYHLAAIELFAARFASARDCFAEAARLAEVSGDDFVRLWAIYFLAVTAIFSGDYVKAEYLSGVCINAWRAQGFERGVALAYVVLGQSLRLNGRATAAEAAVRTGLEIGTAHQDILTFALAERELSALALNRGQVDEAYELIAKSCARLRETGDVITYVRSCALRMRLEAQRGMVGVARSSCAELLQAVRAGAIISLAEAAYGLALILHTEGSEVEALAVLVALSGTPGEDATKELARHLRAELEQRLDPAQRAAATEQARAHDLLPWLEAICARPPAPAVAQAPHTKKTPIVPVNGLFVAETRETLSPREVEVLQLIAAGANNAAIAQQLVISIHTVKTHVANILAKLNVASRTEAALQARELGL